MPTALPETARSAPNPPPAAPDPADVRKTARAAYSRAGFAGLTLVTVCTLGQTLAAHGLPTLFPGISQNPFFFWLATFAPLYLVAMPAAWLVMRRMPATVPAPHRMSAGQFGIAYLMCVAMMYFGNILGTVLSALLSGGSAQNPLTAVVSETTPIQVLVAVFLAPILEELVFRKLLIDRLARFGGGLAVVVSALAFALFHMNLFQFFYAFALGLLFGFLYLRTGLLRYNMLLHIIVNFLGTVVGVQAANLGSVPLIVFGLVQLACSVAGLVLLVRRRKKFTCPAAPEQLPKGSGSVAFCNVGVPLYTLACLAMVVLSLVL